MQSVTSNAVAQAIGGGQIKTYDFMTTITTGMATYGYISKSVPTEIKMVTDLNLSNVIGFTCSWGQISNSKGLQLTLVNVSNGTCYVNYYKPTNLSSNIDIVCRLTYII